MLEANFRVNEKGGSTHARLGPWLQGRSRGVTLERRGKSPVSRSALIRQKGTEEGRRFQRQGRPELLRKFGEFGAAKEVVFGSAVTGPLLAKEDAPRSLKSCEVTSCSGCSRPKRWKGSATPRGS